MRKWYCPNVSTTPLRQWGFQQCLLFSGTTLRGKHCRHPNAVMEVVDTFGHKSIFTRNQWILFPTLTRIFTPLSAKSNDRLLKAFAARVNCKLSSEMLPPTCRAHLAPRARQRIATVLLCFDCSRAAQRQYGGGALDKEETLVARALFDNGAMDFPWFALDKHHIL